MLMSFNKKNWRFLLIKIFTSCIMLPTWTFAWITKVYLISATDSSLLVSPLLFICSSSIFSNTNRFRWTLLDGIISSFAKSFKIMPALYNMFLFSSSSIEVEKMITIILFKLKSLINTQMNVPGTIHIFDSHVHSPSFKLSIGCIIMFGSRHLAVKWKLGKEIKIEKNRSCPKPFVLFANKIFLDQTVYH